MPDSRPVCIESYRAAIDKAVAELCAFAEEQEGNPHDPVSERLYEIAHELELAVFAARFGQEEQHDAR